MTAPTITADSDNNLNIQSSFMATKERGQHWDMKTEWTCDAPLFRRCLGLWPWSLRPVQLPIQTHLRMGIQVQPQSTIRACCRCLRSVVLIKSSLALVRTDGGPMEAP